MKGEPKASGLGREKRDLQGPGLQLGWGRFHVPGLILEIGLTVRHAHEKKLSLQKFS